METVFFFSRIYTTLHCFYFAKACQEKAAADSLVHDGPHHRLAGSVSLVEERVEVRQQRVADVQVVLGTGHQARVGTVEGRILRLTRQITQW